MNNINYKFNNEKKSIKNQEFFIFFFSLNKKNKINKK